MSSSLFLRQRTMAVVSASPPVTASCTKAAATFASRARKEKAPPCEFTFPKSSPRHPLTKNQRKRSWQPAPKPFLSWRTTSACGTSRSVFFNLGYHVLEAANGDDAQRL